MRTTLDIDDDLLQAAKELADTRRTTAGLGPGPAAWEAGRLPAFEARVRSLSRERMGFPSLTLSK